MAQVKDGYYLASGGSLVDERPVSVFTTTWASGQNVQWVRGYNVNRMLAGLLDEGATFVPLAAIEAPGASVQGQEWVPLADGQYIHDSIIDGRIVMTVDDNGGTIDIVGPEAYYSETISFSPFDVRLCQLRKRTPAPALPMPDWDGDTTPGEANYWAVDPWGEAMWYEEEPIRYETITFCGWGPKIVYGSEQGYKWGDKHIELPFGVDWRQTLQRRPAAQGESDG